MNEFIVMVTQPRVCLVCNRNITHSAMCAECAEAALDAQATLLAERDAEITNLRLKRIQAGNVVNNLQGKLADKDAEVASLQSDIESLRKALARLLVACDHPIGAPNYVWWGNLREAVLDAREALEEG